MAVPDYILMLPSFARKWILYEAEDVKSSQMFDVGASVCMTVDVMRPLPHRNQYGGDGFCPLFLLLRESDGYAIGHMVGGVLQGLPPELGHPVSGRFVVDTSSNQIVLNHSVLFTSGYICLTTQASDAFGDVRSLILIFHRDAWTKRMLTYICFDQRSCRPCREDKKACKCSDQVRKSSIKALADRLQGLQLHVDSNSAWSAFANVGMEVFRGAFGMELVITNHLDGDKSSVGLPIEITCFSQGPFLESRKREYLRQLDSSVTQPSNMLALSAPPDPTLEGPSEQRRSTSPANVDANEEKKDQEASPQCEHCGTTFRRVYELRRHIDSVHRGVKNYQCTYCDRDFFQASHLRTHIRGVHERVRDVRCPQCDRCFASKDKLQRHIRSVHLRERRCVCDICGKKYFQNSDLRKHKTLQHERGGTDSVAKQDQGAEGAPRHTKEHV